MRGDSRWHSCDDERLPRRTHTLRDSSTLPLPLTAPAHAPALLSAGTLFTANAHGALRPATDDEILDAARTILASRVRRGRALASPRHTRDYLRLQLAHLDHELFAILFLDNRHRVIEFAPLFRGTIDGASVHPREVVKECLTRNAAAVILAHNHPSGIAEPSAADELITQRVKDALSHIDVRVLDHFVVTGDDVVSLAERGLL